MVWKVMVVICLLSFYGFDISWAYLFFCVLLLLLLPCRCFSDITILRPFDDCNQPYTRTHTHTLAQCRKIIFSPSIAVCSSVRFRLCVYLLLHCIILNLVCTSTQAHSKNVPSDFSSITWIHSIRKSTYEMSKIPNEHENCYWFLCICMSSP